MSYKVTPCCWSTTEIEAEIEALETSDEWSPGQVRHYFSVLFSKSFHNFMDFYS